MTAAVCTLKKRIKKKVARQTRYEKRDLAWERGRLRLRGATIVSDHVVLTKGRTGKEPISAPPPREFSVDRRFQSDDFWRSRRSLWD